LIESGLGPVPLRAAGACTQSGPHTSRAFFAALLTYRTSDALSEPTAPRTPSPSAGEQKLRAKNDDPSIQSRSLYLPNPDPLGQAHLICHRDVRDAPAGSGHLIRMYRRNQRQGQFHNVDEFRHHTFWDTECKPGSTHFWECLSRIHQQSELDLNEFRQRTGYHLPGNCDWRGLWHRRRIATDCFVPRKQLYVYS
jgi:hypothetical protein